MPYSFRMSAIRSTSPVAEAKKATLCPDSTSVRASAMATCILPWKVIEGRVGTCALVASPDADQPISICWNFDLRSRAGLLLQVFPAEEDPVRVVGGGALDLLQPRPQAFGGADDLLRLVPDHRRLLQQREHRGVARPQHGRDQFPARERSRRAAADRARDVRLLHQLVQFRQKAAAISGIPSTVAAGSPRPSGPTAATPHRSAGSIPPGRRRGRCAPASALPAGRCRECRRGPSTRPPFPPVRAARSRCSPGAPPPPRAAAPRRRAGVSASWR